MPDRRIAQTTRSHGTWRERPGRTDAARLQAGCCLLAAMACVSADAAALFTETFAEGASGWRAVGTGASFTDGYARCSFAQQFGPPTPESARLACTNGSAGAFTGNFAAADAQIVGFDFMALTTLPVGLKLFLRGGVTEYQRALATIPAQTGVWYTLAIDVTGKAKGAWVGAGGEAEFTATLAAVDEIYIEVERSGAAAQEYRIDNVYLDCAPVAAGSDVVSGVPTFAWSHVRSNRVYTARASTDLDGGAWMEATVFTASASTVQVPWTNEPVAYHHLGTRTD